MNKKILTIAVALVILAVVVAPAAAQLPAKDPLPKGNPWDIVWTWLKDLQKQITDLAARVTGLETEVDNLPTAHFGEWDTASYSLNTEYTAATDGFVVASVTLLGTGPVAVIGSPDTSDPADPYVQMTLNNPGEIQAFTMPVRAGDSWRVVNSGTGSVVSNIEWLPLTT